MRTYFFQIRKCDNPSCDYHGVLRGSEPITPFPDPIPYEDDGVMRYKEGTDKDEAHLPSKIEDPSKMDHKIPFTPSAQTAKNVGLVVKCDECCKPRLLHAKHKLKGQQFECIKTDLK